MASSLALRQTGIVCHKIIDALMQTVGTSSGAGRCSAEAKLNI
jgi:hypothetical protein